MKLKKNFYERWWVVALDVISLTILGGGLMSILLSPWGLVVFPTLIWAGLRIFWAVTESRANTQKKLGEEKRQERYLQEQSGKN